MLAHSCPTRLIVALIALLVSPASAWPQAVPGPGPGPAEPPRPPTAERGSIALAGHGALLDTNGAPIDPDRPAMARWISDTLERHLAAADPDPRERLSTLRERAATTLEIEDTMLSSLMLEWLLEQIELRGRAHLHAINRTIRFRWYSETLGDEPFLETFDTKAGLPRDLVNPAEELQLLMMPTMSSGEEYIGECREARVPPPPDWGNSDWQQVKDLNVNFLGFGNPVQVWRSDHSDPDGLCMALPRITEKPGSEDEWISALGIICLGHETGNACFYDAAGVELDEDRPIQEFQSGGTLTNGVCSDCHAGENPFVVHPHPFWLETPPPLPDPADFPLDMRPATRSPVWHVPLVKPDWPQNPGPLTLLEAIDLKPGDRSCLECHGDGGIAGRFPDVLALNSIAEALAEIPGDISGYCVVILRGAIDTFQTMPTDPEYERHRDAMRAFCLQAAVPETVPLPDTPDDPDVVSPPLLGSLYACVEVVEVRGLIYGGELTLSINGVDLPTVPVTMSEMSIKTPPLVEGDTVVARLNVDGTVATSDPVEVISHLVDYPDGLPAPQIDPGLIHQCGRVIAVRHVENAFVTVLSNGADPVEYALSGDWTNVVPAKRPFDLGDRFTARQRMCEDVSPLSAAHEAVAPPAPMPVPKLNPEPPDDGQPYVAIESLANGALTTVGEAGLGDLLDFSTAVDFDPEVDVGTPLGRLILPGDSFTVTSKLCEAVTVEVPEVKPCEVLRAPRIAQPFVGDVSVTVTNSAPGARILVYDAGSAEIGDGMGFEIGLTRALVQGDVLTVMQRIGDCVSDEAYQVAAICTSFEDCDLG